jgi:hypothetical protein
MTSGVNITPGASARIDAILNVGSVAETVEVTAAAVQ